MRRYFASNFLVNYADYISKIESLSYTNFSTWNNRVHAILKELDLDYALNEEKPHGPSLIYDYNIERMKEYTHKLEFPYVIIFKLIISQVMRPCRNCVTTVKPHFEGEKGLSHQERDALFK